MICANCSKPLSKAEAVVEHIVPISKGGGNMGDANLRVVHRQCHRISVKWYVRLGRAIARRWGEMMCFLGRHKWRPDGPITHDYRSKWEIYEVCRGKCDRPGCKAKADEIRRDYYW